MTTNILHPFANEETKDELNKTHSEPLKFVKELCFKFNLKVFAYFDKEFILLNRHDNYVGKARADHVWSENKQTHRYVYSFMSEQIQKERGRGSARHTRTSENVKSLIKLLSKELKEEKEPTYPRIANCWNNIQSQIERRVGSSGFSSMLSGYKEWCVLQNIFDDTPINMDTLEEIKEIYEKHKKRNVEVQERRNEVNKFKKAYMLYGTDSTPVRYGVVCLEDSKYVVQGEMKSCHTFDDLPENIKVHMKMYKIAKEAELNLSSSRVTPLHSHMVRNDRYDRDFETVTYYGSNFQEGTEYFYVFPYTDAN